MDEVGTGTDDVLWIQYDGTYGMPQGGNRCPEIARQGSPRAANNTTKVHRCHGYSV